MERKRGIAKTTVGGRRGEGGLHEDSTRVRYLTVAVMAFSLACRGGDGSRVTAPVAGAEVEVCGAEVDVEAGIQEAAVL